MIIMFKPQQWERQNLEFESKKARSQGHKINLASLHLIGMMSLATILTWKSAHCLAAFCFPPSRPSEKARATTAFIPQSCSNKMLCSWSNDKQVTTCLSFLINGLRKTSFRSLIVLSTAAQCSRAWVMLVPSRFLNAAISVLSLSSVSLLRLYD